MLSAALKRTLLVCLLPGFLALAACSGQVSLFASKTPTPTSTRTPTPTETPIPPALVVNGEAVSREDFAAEVERYKQAQAAMGNQVGEEEARQAVHDEYVDSLLLKQEAAEQGMRVDDAMLQGRLDSLALELDDADALADWQAAHGYTAEQFASALRLQIAAAWMRDQLIAAVPIAQEQVHARQILVSTLEAARQAQDQLQAGWAFSDLAYQYDPVTGGELGWFPRGYLPSQEIEQAVFALQEGETTDIIQDETGYHLIFLEERQASRELSADALLNAQERALSDWLILHRNESTIVFTP